MNLIEKIYEAMTTDRDGNDKQARILEENYTSATEDQKKQLTGFLSRFAAIV
jgi:hypothetical protein